MSLSWKEHEPDTPGSPVPFSVHEKDRAHIRDNILAAVIHAPSFLRYLKLIRDNIIATVIHAPDMPKLITDIIAASSIVRTFWDKNSTNMNRTYLPTGFGSTTLGMTPFFPGFIWVCVSARLWSTISLRSGLQLRLWKRSVATFRHPTHRVRD